MTLPIKDWHRSQAAMIVGSLSDTKLQESLKEEIAVNLARAEARGFESGAEVFSEGNIRVVRVLEYVYPDAATMELDMSNWAVARTMRGPKGTWIRSTTLPPEVLGA